MKLSNLETLIKRDKKRVGRGIGSGKGKAGGRGTKGQKARGKIPAAFVGGSLPLYKKLPFVRGWGNKKAHLKPQAITLDQLNGFKANSKVSMETLLETRVVTGRAVVKSGVKILNKGDIQVKGLVIEVAVSKEAQAKIEKAGGRIV